MPKMHVTQRIACSFLFGLHLSFLVGTAQAQSSEDIDQFLGSLLKSPIGASITGYRSVIAPFKDALKAGQEDAKVFKLKIMLENQRKILENLESLKFKIDEALNKNFFDDTVGRLNGEFNAYRVLSTFPESSERQYELSRILRNVGQIAEEIRSYNKIILLPAYISALATLNVIQQAVDSSPQAMRATLGAHYSNLNADLDPSSAGTTARKVNLQRKIASYELILNTPRAFLIGKFNILVKIHDLSATLPIDISVDYQPFKNDQKESFHVVSTLGGAVESNTAMTSSSYEPNVYSGSDLELIPCFSESKVPFQAVLAPSDRIVTIARSVDQAIAKRKECVTTQFKQILEQIVIDRQELDRLEQAENAVIALRDSLKKQLAL